MGPDGPKRGPRGVPRGSQIGLPRPSNIEAEKGSAPPNLKRGSGPFLGPSWGPYRPYVGPLGVIFGLILSILARRAQKSKNEGPPMQNAHFWGPKRALEGPCWGYVGVKLASSGHLNISYHHLSDEGRYKGGRVTFWGGSKRTPRRPVAQNPVFLVGTQRIWDPSWAHRGRMLGLIVATLGLVLAILGLVYKYIDSIYIA